MARRIGLGRGLDALLDNNDEVFQNDNTPVPLAETPKHPKKTAREVSASHDMSASHETAASQEAAAGSAAQASSHNGTVQLPVDKLIPNPGQPRKNFDETELNELAQSIKTYGIIQPVIAADTGDGSYIIIAGERRTRAARLAGLNEVPAIIRDYTDQKRMEVSLIENIQRSGLNPMEEAAAYKNLMDFSGLSQDELASRVGKNRSTVANALRLLKLPVEIQKSVEEGKISSGHARALLSVNNAKARDKLYRELLAKDISVREAEKKAAALGESGTEKTGQGSAKSKQAKKHTPELDAMTEKFIGRLGTKVEIEGDMNKGRIHIDYYSMEDLERLYEILG
ncbi:MAG: ParB/RepB/Spo0J family partition protein [Treponema sp.]|nr:ParB/RepB/Spo0J family partition protein [Treponema sp.]